jgi:hypothetical protein
VLTLGEWMRLDGRKEVEAATDRCHPTPAFKFGRSACSSPNWVENGQFQTGMGL